MQIFDITQAEREEDDEEGEEEEHIIYNVV